MSVRCEEQLRHWYRIWFIIPQDPCYLECDMRTNSISIIWDLIRNAESQAPSTTYWIREGTAGAKLGRGRGMVRCQFYLKTKINSFTLPSFPSPCPPSLSLIFFLSISHSLSLFFSFIIYFKRERYTSQTEAATSLECVPYKEQYHLGCCPRLSHMKEDPDRSSQ